MTWEKSVLHHCFSPQEKGGTKSWLKTSTKPRELRDLEASRTAENLGDSKRARTCAIIEHSNDDVQVFRTVKNRVSTALDPIAPLL